MTNLAKTLIGNDLTLFYRPDESFVGQSIALGTYEPYETKLFIDQIKNGDVVMNIGANIGYYTLLSSQKAGTNGHVIAVEPDPATFSILKQNISINRLKNVTALNIAISDKKSKSFLYPSTKNYGDHRMYPDDTEPRKPISIKTNTIDNIIKLLNIKKLNLLKIDTQGYEPYVVNGALKSLKKYTPIIFLEYWPYGYKKSMANSKLMIDRLIHIYRFLFFIDEAQKNFSKPSFNYIDKYCEQKNGFQHTDLIFTNSTNFPAGNFSQNYLFQDDYNLDLSTKTLTKCRQLLSTIFLS